MEFSQHNGCHRLIWQGVQRLEVTLQLSQCYLVNVLLLALNKNFNP